MLKELALKGAGLLQIAELIVADDIANGQLQLIFPEFSCVEADGTEPAMWLVYPDRSLTSRSRLCTRFSDCANEGRLPGQSSVIFVHFLHDAIASLHTNPSIRFSIRFGS